MLNKHIKTTREEFEKKFVRDDGLMDKYQYSEGLNAEHTSDVVQAFIEKRERLLAKKIKKDVLRILDEELVTPLDINTIGKVPDDEWKVLSIKRLEKRIKEL